MLIRNKSPHGGLPYGKLDFSSNINPFGVPDGVRRALEVSVSDCQSYPDPYCTGLRKAISSYERVPAENIICGNGATELIYSFAYSLPKGKPALIVSPSFSEYESALNAAGIKAEHHILTAGNGFHLTDDILDTDLSRYGAVFLGTPNNPTGASVDRVLLRRIVETGVRLLADMCFLDLTEDPGRYDIPTLTERHPNVVVLRAFTKNYALAGIRLGYAICSDWSFMDLMTEKAPCWNVSSVAQRAGEAAAGCRQWLSGTVARICRERERVSKALESYGVRVFHGEANYLLIHSDRDLCPELAKRGIIVRDCSNYIGLGKGYVRIAIRTEADNDRLLSAIREVQE